MKMKLIMENWNKFLKESPVAMSSPSAGDQTPSAAEEEEMLSLDNLDYVTPGGYDVSDIDDFSNLEIVKKAASQERNLRRAGFRSMEKLQGMVGADRTGVYDTQTMEKIMAFQRNLGLEGKDVDGIYGAGTRRALKNTGNKTPEELARLAAMAAGVDDPGAVNRSTLASKRNKAEAEAKAAAAAAGL